MKYVNPETARLLIPEWALPSEIAANTIDWILRQYLSDGPMDEDRLALSWIEINTHLDRFPAELKTHTERELWSGQVFIFCKSILGGNATISLPLLDMMYPARKMHTLYAHQFDVDVPLIYWGVTKNGWIERLSQHVSSAQRGSRLLFHDAIRQHQSVDKVHRVLVTGVDFETAMDLEEEFVGTTSLYPLGLNMIPGGFAGLRYLAKLGIKSRTVGERDEALERLSSQSHIGSRPNPLCAARWASDQDYVNRVICGHSGRLTVDQVKNIRMWSDFGRGHEDISGGLDVPLAKIANVLSGKRYKRVA